MSTTNPNGYMVQKTHDLFLLYKDVVTHKLGLGRAGLMTPPPELPDDVESGVDLLHNLISNKVEVSIRYKPTLFVVCF